MVNLRDTRGAGRRTTSEVEFGHLTHPIHHLLSLLLGKTAQVSLISVRTELSMVSISGGQGLHVTYVQYCAVTFLGRDG